MLRLIEEQAIERKPKRPVAKATLQKLGHEDLQTTIKKYGHWSESRKQAQAEKLAGIFPV